MLSFLLILPLGLFAVILLLVVSTTASVEISERRRAKRHSRRRFRPVIIEGGRGKTVAADPGPAAPDAALHEPERLKLVRSVPL